MWLINIFCTVWRYAIIFLTLLSMIDMWLHHSVETTWDFLVDVALAAWIWHDYIKDTYKYEVELYFQGYLVRQFKFLSLSQQERMLGRLYKAGATRMENVQ